MKTARPTSRVASIVKVLGFVAAGVLAASMAVAGAEQGSKPSADSNESLPTDPLGWEQSGFLHNVSRIRADVVRRSGGEWVIVRLALGSVGAGASPSGTASKIEDHPALQAMLREYGEAFQEQDAQRLAGVWLMNPLERKEIDKLFAEKSSVDVSVSRPVLRLEGDHGSLEFDQRFVVSGLPQTDYSLRNALQRALAAHDAYGDWGVDAVLDAR